MRTTARSVRSSCRDCSLRSMATLIFFSVAHFSAFFSRSLLPGFNFCCAIVLSSSLLFVSALTPIPSASWHAFVAECLSESGAEVTGECTTWASGNDYGTMPNWDTSLVEDMSGWSGVEWIGLIKALAVEVHSTATSRSGILRK